MTKKLDKRQAMIDYIVDDILYDGDEITVGFIYGLQSQVLKELEKRTEKSKKTLSSEWIHWLRAVKGGN